MDAGRIRRDAWLPFFVLSVGALIGSVVALGVVLWQAAGDDELGTADPAGAADESSNRALSYFGPLPASLVDAGYVAAATPDDADILFERSASADAVAVRYFVPIASLATGLDSITASDLARLVAGELTLAEAGGLGGHARYLTATVPGDAELVTAFLPGAGEHITSYEALIAEVAASDDAIAFIPLDLVTPAVNALAVDGVDIVRGRGAAAAWPYAERMIATGRSSRGEDAASSLLATMAAPMPQVIRIVATGDILQARCSLTAIRAVGDWGAPLRGPVAEYLAAADLALGSLDTSIQDIGEPWGCISTTNLTSPPETIEALTLAGFDELSVATNHIFDCGQQFCENRAFLRTLELLTRAGIKYAGGGRNLEEALAPVIFGVNGVRFGILAFDDIAAYELEATATDPGTAPLDDSYEEENAAGEPAFFRPAEELSLERFTTRIKALKAEVDVVIVQVQTGTEDTHDPSPRSIKALRAAADAGADLIIGNQAHHAQAIEVRGDAYIAYALGNFIFDQVWTPEHTQGYVVEATFWGAALANVRLVPYEIVDKYRPTFVDGELRAKILGDVFAATDRLPSGE